MVSIEQIGLVRKFSIARTVFGRNLYFTAAYFVDGLMIDTGCAHASREFTQALHGLHVHLIANTHSHEDHVGANAALQNSLKIKILAHPVALPFLSNPRLRQLHPYRPRSMGISHRIQGTGSRKRI